MGSLSGEQQICQVTEVRQSKALNAMRGTGNVFWRPSFFKFVASRSCTSPLRSFGITNLCTPYLRFNQRNFTECVSVCVCVCAHWSIYLYIYLSSIYLFRIYFSHDFFPQRESSAFKKSLNCFCNLKKQKARVPQDQQNQPLNEHLGLRTTMADYRVTEGLRQCRKQQRYADLLNQNLH